MKTFARIQNLVCSVKEINKMSPCTLLKLKGFIPIVAALLQLECSEERLRLLTSLDAAEEQAYATDCISIETLDTFGKECQRTFETSMGTFIQLYNETKGSRFLEMVSMQNAMNCQCTTFTPASECEKCTKVTMMRQLGSPERTKILNLHSKRATSANNVRQEYAYLLKAAKKTKDYYCEEYPSECSFVSDLISSPSPDPTIKESHETQEFVTPL